MDTKDVAGVAGLPEASENNGCDTIEAAGTPPNSRRNPMECRTFQDLPCGWTYFIQRKDMLIKIGFSAMPRKRIKSLRREFGRGLKTLTVVPSSVAGEFETHQQFEHLRVEGEWFQPADDLWKFIRQVHKLGAKAEIEIAKGPKPQKPPGPSDMAKQLTACRRRHGFDSTIGRHCTGLLEAMPTYQVAKDPVQRAYLAQSIARYEAGLGRALKEAA